MNLNTGALIREFNATSTLDAEDYFGGNVTLQGSYALVTASGDDDLGSNSGATYIFNASTGEEIFKATGIESSLMVGSRLFENNLHFNTVQGRAFEYDFFATMDISASSVDLRTSSISSGTLGAFSFFALEQISISESVASLSGGTNTASISTMRSVDAIADNILRMEARLHSTHNRLQNDFDRVISQRDSIANLTNDSIQETLASNSESSNLAVLDPTKNNSLSISSLLP